MIYLRLAFFCRVAAMRHLVNALLRIKQSSDRCPRNCTDKCEFYASYANKLNINGLSYIPTE